MGHVWNHIPGDTKIRLLLLQMSLGSLEQPHLKNGERQTDNAMEGLKLRRGIYRIFFYIRNFLCLELQVRINISQFKFYIMCSYIGLEMSLHIFGNIILNNLKPLVKESLMELKGAGSL